MKHQKNIHYLVCINKEEYSITALKFACEKAKKNNGSLIMLHIIEPINYQSLGTVEEKMRQEKRTEAENLLQELCEMTVEKYHITPVVIFKEGRIEEEIIKVIEEDNTISMLIVGSATESSPKSKILPPLVSEMGKKIFLPMLIVPGNLTDHQIKLLS